MNYSYPLDSDWSIDEIVDVIAYYNAIEEAYEQGIKKEDFMKAYRRFTQIVSMKSEQRRLQDEFEEVSGYNGYAVFKKAQEVDFIRM